MFVPLVVLLVFSGLDFLPPVTAAQNLIAETKMLDLTYTFDDKTIYWPGNKSFQWENQTGEQPRLDTARL